MRLQGPITAAAWLNQESKANWTNANTGSTQLTIFVLQPENRRTRYATNNNKMPHRTNPIFPTCVPKKKAWYSSDPSDPTSGPKDQNNPHITLITQISFWATAYASATKGSLHAARPRIL